MLSNSNKPVVVIGNGWSALAATAILSSQGAKVRWLAGTGARMLAALPSLESGAGVEAWRELAARHGIEAGGTSTGSFVREFRNKAFREPAWTHAPTPEARREVLAETLWAPERALASAFEARFQLTINEIEEQLRAKYAPEELPVTGFRIETGGLSSVILGSGEEIECEHAIYADRWSALAGLGGLPKALPFTRRRDPMGILQATFAHEVPMGVGVAEGIFGSLHKEAGEEIERHVWGHFSSDGRKSYWTLCIAADEVEDNHQIAKKLRRMKNALDKMFTGETWLPAGKPEFMNTVVSEQVRFQEAMIFAEGEAPEAPVTISQAKGLSFVTDGYGPSAALRQVSAFMERRPEPQAENVNLADAGAL